MGLATFHILFGVPHITVMNLNNVMIPQYLPPNNKKRVLEPTIPNTPPTDTFSSKKSQEINNLHNLPPTTHKICKIG